MIKLAIMEQAPTLLSLYIIITIYLTTETGRIINRPQIWPGALRRVLNLGCRLDHFAPFINVNFLSIRIGRGRKDHRPNWLIDIRRPLKCENDYWDGVVAEHIFEYLTPADALGGLRKNLRTLKPARQLRINVQKLKLIAEIYVHGDIATFNDPVRT
ncbi:MAG: hypothetical protein VYE18_04285 [Pseudomonadota bacterium]|nr:hypothetical protein [Pseudomonadota bacterium]